MEVWNVLHAARCKYRTQKYRKKSPPVHHPTTLSGYVFATVHVSTIGNKVVKQQYLLHMFSQYGELRPTSGWDRFLSLRHPSKFQRLSCLGSVTARQSSSERQPNFAAFNRGCHLCLAGRPPRWALAHTLVATIFQSLWIWNIRYNVKKCTLISFHHCRHSNPLQSSCTLALPLASRRHTRFIADSGSLVQRSAERSTLAYSRCLCNCVVK